MPRSKPPSNPSSRPPQWLAFGPTVCSELELCLEKEWYLGNGLGGYAAGTVVGCPTRSRHGLLIASTRPPNGLISLLLGFEETFFVLDQPYPLSTFYFRDSIYPKGYEHLKRFSLNPFPTFTFEVEDFRLEKTLYIRRGRNTVVVHYRLISGEEELVRLEIKPLVTCRPLDEVRKNTQELETELTTSKGQVCYRSSKHIPPIYFAHQAAIVDKTGGEFGEIVYPRDQEEGGSATERLYHPCSFIYSFMAHDEVLLAASTQPIQLPSTPALWLNEERDRVLAKRKHFFNMALKDRQGVAAEEKETSEEVPDSADEIPVLTATEEIQHLVSQTENFVIGRGEGGLSILRGYLGASDGAWSTMIALPGLFLVSRRYEEAKEILLYYASLVDKGFLPSSFRSADGHPVYESIDAALWFIEAVFLYCQESEDYSGIEKKLYPVIRRIIKHYQRGAHYGVRAVEDGLIEQEESKKAITWMNAYVGTTPVTPRWGKAVEVNALWYNAIRIVEYFAIKFRDAATAKAMDRLALKVYDSFNSIFWNEKKGLVVDCVQHERKDLSVRPNQILTLSLSFPVLQKKCWPVVLQTITQELFTPFGLRTLSKKSKSYRGQYGGDRLKRSQAEHQGTVWAWLMGPYVRAYLKTYGSEQLIREKLLKLFEPFFNQLSHFGLNSISSVYDGNAPHSPRGFIGDACAAGEIIRCYEELISEGPKKQTLEKFEWK